MTGAISKCQQLVEKTPDAFCLQQFENPANPEVHYKTTGPEIWRDTAGRVDYLVAGIASLLPRLVGFDGQAYLCLAVGVSTRLHTVISVLWVISH